MTQDDTKLKDLLERIKNLPEDQELPDEILDELTQEQIIAIYVEKMIADKGVEATDELRLTLREQISEAVTTNLVNAMPDYLIDKLNNDIDANAGDDVISAAIDESGIDVEAITMNTMTEFRNNYLAQEEK